MENREGNGGSEGDVPDKERYVDLGEDIENEVGNDNPEEDYKNGQQNDDIPLNTNAVPAVDFDEDVALKENSLENDDNAHQVCDEFSAGENLEKPKRRSTRLQVVETVPSKQIRNEVAKKTKRKNVVVNMLMFKILVLPSEYVLLKVL